MQTKRTTTRRLLSWTWSRDVGVRKGIASSHFRTSSVLHRAAQVPEQLAVAAHGYWRAFQASRPDSQIHRRAREKLVLLLCQEGLCAPREIDRLLRPGGFTVRLSLCLLRYRKLRPVHPFSPPPSGTAYAVEGALPRGMLKHLRLALGPSSTFWRAHGYRCGLSSFFSYVHPLDQPGRCGLDRVIQLLHAHVVSYFPKAAAATRAEWWAHCRPHSTGHQLHFDSDDEGRGGVRHPIVSVALYLTGGVGGPTLITEQHAARSTGLPRQGWAILPKLNRAVMFDGSLLHCVVPGRGPAPRSASGKPRRRISLMVAFWSAICEKDGDKPGAARPFPYASLSKSGMGASTCTSKWVERFDWDTQCDNLGHGRGTPACEDGRNASSELWPVRPVWEPVLPCSMPKGSLPIRMPAYDECFQGF